jgi:hypothetical protein
MSTTTLQPLKSFKCSGCGKTYDARAWWSFSVLHRIDASEIQLRLLGWSDGFFVEVRSCERCARPISARRERAEVAA